MKDEITNLPASTIENTVTQLEGGDIAVTASSPCEMEECQQALIAWADRKLKLVETEAAELKEAFEHAKQQKWKTVTLERHAKLAVKRVEFYSKVKLALENGYHIVPNFPVQAIAIRTKAKKPKPYTQVMNYIPDLIQDGQILPAGEGEYQNPFPVVYGDSFKDGDKIKNRYWADHWGDLEFPISMAKPEIMEAATRAQALKIFDEIGVLPEARKEDPILVGQVKLKTGPYSTKRISFLIAWHLDTRVL